MNKMTGFFLGQYCFFYNFAIKLIIKIITIIYQSLKSINMKKLNIFAFMAFFCLLVSSCGGVSQSDLVGYWVADDESIMQFKEDGTYVGASKVTSKTLDTDGSVISEQVRYEDTNGKYKLDGDNIIVTVDGQELPPIKVAISGDEMTINQDDQNIKLKRISEAEYTELVKKLINEQVQQ